MKEFNPLSLEKLKELLKPNPDDSERILTRENSIIEFKESYNHGSMAVYFKTIAAFANHKGGYIVFGIKDKPHICIGLKNNALQQFDEIDVEIFTGNLCDYFSPEIDWQHCIFEFNGKKFGVIYITELDNKPCICKKTYDNKNPKYCLKEGDIYYRYRGRSERIHYSELIQMLQEQKEKESKAWMLHLERILRAGPTNVATIDFSAMDMCLNDGSGFILDRKLAKELLSKVKLIKEGYFSEIKGKPTLKLVGNLTIPEEMPVPDVDIDVTYPYILKDLAEVAGITPQDVKALLWKYGLVGDKKYNLSFQASPKNKYPNQKYSKYAIKRLKEILEANKNPDFLKEIRMAYNHRND